MPATSKPSGTQLAAVIGLPTAIAMIVSSIVGSGIYKKVAPMSAELQSPTLVLACWVLGGLVSLAGALSNAEVAGLLAGTGGEYRYYRTIYNRFFSFLYGWASFAVIRSASIASIAYVFSQSFNALVPLPVVSAELASVGVFGVIFPFENLSVKLLTVAVVLALTWVNGRGVKLGGQISQWLTGSVLVGILTIVVFGLSSESSHLSNLQHSVATPAHSTSVGLFTSIFTAMLAAFWAYEGWSSIGYIGGEIKNPNRNLPIVLLTGLLIVMALYLLTNAAYLSLLPIEELTRIKNTPNAIAAVEAVRVFWGEGGVYFISILILLTTLGCTHTTILLAARAYYAMAQEGLFFEKAAVIDPQSKTPNNALWIQGVWTSILIFTGSFDQLTDMLIFASFLFYGATTLGVFILRRKMPDAPRPYKAFGYPVVPALFIIFCVFLIFNTLQARPREALMGIGLMLTGVPFYWYWTRKKANL